MQIRGTDSDQLSRRLEDEVERNSTSLSGNVDAEGVVEIRSEQDNLLLQLNDYKVSYEHLECKVK